MAKIGLISDTHNYLGNDVLNILKNVDEIWHAGDIGQIEIADQLNEIAPLRAVYGNIDDNKIRTEYPLDLTWTAHGLKVYMTHIGGYPNRYTKRAKEMIQQFEPQLFISGHSHILKVIRDKKLKLIHFNPGACGIIGFHKFRTMLRFEINAGKIEHLQAIEFGLRSQINR